MPRYAKLLIKHGLEFARFVASTTWERSRWKRQWGNMMQFVDTELHK